MLSVGRTPVWDIGAVYEVEWVCHGAVSSVELVVESQHGFEHPIASDLVTSLLLAPLSACLLFLRR